MKIKISIISNILLFLYCFFLPIVYGLPSEIIGYIFIIFALVLTIINLNHALNIKHNLDKTKQFERILLMTSNVLLLLFGVCGVIAGGFDQTLLVWFFILLLMFVPIINLSLFNFWDNSLKFLIHLRQSIIMIKTKGFIKRNKILIVVVLVFVSYIYFSNIRPSQIRKRCSNYVTYDIGEPSEYSIKVQKVSDDQYNSCLRQNGLEN